MNGARRDDLCYRTRWQRHELISLPNQRGRRLKDVTFRRDASLIHVGHRLMVMAPLRDPAVPLLHRAVALVVGPLPTGAYALVPCVPPKGEC